MFSSYAARSARPARPLHPRAGAFLVAAFSLPLTFLPAAAQEPGWSFTSELSAVLSDGNAVSRTLGLGAEATRAGERTLLALTTKAVRTEASKTTRTAVGSAGSFTVREETVRETTAEALNARARLDRTLSERVFAFGGVDWLRNTFAGVDGRFLVAGGSGVTWVDSETGRFKTDLAGTYTFQSDVVENPLVKTSFPGLRVGLQAWRRVSPSAEITSEVVTDWNIDEPADVRTDWTSSLTLSVTRIIAFKPSAQLLWRNRPSLTNLDLVAPDGSETGQRVAVPLEKVDAFFRLALVVTL